MIRNGLHFCRLAVVAAFVGAVVAGSHAGEAIVFSNPDTAIAAPKRDNLPQLPGVPNDLRGLGFGQELQAPSLTPYMPPVNRNEQRKAEKKSIFDEPDIFSDKSKKKDEAGAGEDINPFARNQRNANQAPLGFQPFDPMHKQELDRERALSPVRQFDWNPEQAKTKGNDPSGRPGSSASPKSEQFGFFATTRDESDQSGFGTFFGAFRQKELNTKREITRNVERQAEREEFQKMLNPGFTPGNPDVSDRLSGRLFAIDPVKPPAAAPVMTPIPSIAPETDRSMDPTTAFNYAQQSHLRGPTMEDFNRKAMGPAASPARPQVQPVDQRKPLMSQPTFPDFPARRF